MNEDVSIGGYTVKVSDISQTNAFTANNHITSSQASYPAKGTYYLVNVTVTNAAKQAATLELGQFKLMDSAGAEYTPTSILEADQLDVPIIEDNTTLNPNEQAKGYLLFDLPQVQGEYQLKFSSSGTFDMSEGSAGLFRLRQTNAETAEIPAPKPVVPATTISAPTGTNKAYSNEKPTDANRAKGKQFLEKYLGKKSS